MLAYPSSHDSIRQRNRDRFSKLHFRGLCRKGWGFLSGKRCDLIALSEIEKAIVVTGRHSAGVQPVALNKILGSEGRCSDFDRRFRPLKKHNHERWLSIALARENDVPLPAIDLIKVGQRFFVRDGHHRISVARIWGQKEMEAAVTVWETESNIEDILAVAQNKNGFAEAMIRIKRSLQRLLNEVMHPDIGQSGGGFSAGSGGSAFQGGRSSFQTFSFQL